jgi:hypothetical protein
MFIWLFKSVIFRIFQYSVEVSKMAREERQKTALRPAAARVCCADFSCASGVVSTIAALSGALIQCHQG